MSRLTVEEMTALVAAAEVLLETGRGMPATRIVLSRAARKLRTQLDAPWPSRLRVLGQLLTPSRRVP